MNPIILNSAISLAMKMVVELIDQILTKENIIQASEPYRAQWHLEHNAILGIEDTDGRIKLKLHLPGMVHIVSDRSKESISFDLRWVEEAMGQVLAILRPDTLEEKTGDDHDLIESLEREVEVYEELVAQGRRGAITRLKAVRRALNVARRKQV